jgi:hypothetical protein
MKTDNKKRTYLSPQIERVLLDNEISLALESTPPSDPEPFSENFRNDPFKTNMA